MRQRKANFKRKGTHLSNSRWDTKWKWENASVHSTHAFHPASIIPPTTCGLKQKIKITLWGPQNYFASYKTLRGPIFKRQVSIIFQKHHRNHTAAFSKRLLPSTLAGYHLPVLTPHSPGTPQRKLLPQEPRAAALLPPSCRWSQARKEPWASALQAGRKMKPPKAPRCWKIRRQANADAAIFQILKEAVLATSWCYIFGTQ